MVSKEWPSVPRLFQRGHEVGTRTPWVPGPRAGQAAGGHTNGNKPKTIHTRLGALSLANTPGPWGRVLSLGPGGGESSERALKLAVAKMYVQGVSTRKVAAITEKLCSLEASFPPPGHSLTLVKCRTTRSESTRSAKSSERSHPWAGKTWLRRTSRKVPSVRLWSAFGGCTYRTRRRWAGRG